MSNANVHFITGGQRSGKSEYAEQLALSLSDSPNYLATSKVWDDDYQKRINIHQNRRDNRWQTIEELIDIAKVSFSNYVVLLDCITLWLTNIYDAQNYDVDKTIAYAKKQWDELCQKNITLIVVSNEVGLGVIPMESASRKFVDIQGKINQYIAQKATKATFIVAGLPLKLK